MKIQLESIGYRAGGYNTEGVHNIFMGKYSGYNHTIGHDNVFLGKHAGFHNIKGINNVFIGEYAGYHETDSNKLYIGTNYNKTLIYGEFDNNKVGINTDYVPEDYTLAVKGNIIAEELKVRDFDTWPDYVFQEDYPLLPLNAIEKHIDDKGHLPGIPSAQEVAEEGISLGEFSAKLLEKIEELTLHVIEQEKAHQALESELRQEIQSLKEELNHQK